MPAGRKKNIKSISDQDSPPRSVSPSGTTPIPDTNFEHFVRQSLTEIQAGQVELRNHIQELEVNINASIEFQCKRIDALELKASELDGLTARMVKVEKVMADHAEQVNKLE